MANAFTMSSDELQAHVKEQFEAFVKKHKDLIAVGMLGGEVTEKLLIVLFAEAYLQGVRFGADSLMEEAQRRHDTTTANDTVKV